MRLTEIRVAGFGGQGVILSAIVLGKAASIYEDGFATMTQNFGPEARGGACTARSSCFRTRRCSIRMSRGRTFWS